MKKGHWVTVSLVLLVVFGGLVWLLNARHQSRANNFEEVATTVLTGSPSPQSPLSEDQTTSWENLTLEQVEFGKPYEVMSVSYNLQIVSWVNTYELIVLRDLDPAGNNEAIEILDMRTQETRRVAEGALVQMPVWLPTARQVAYVVNSQEKVEGLPRRDLWISSIDTSDSTLLREDVNIPLIAGGSAETLAVATRTMRRWIRIEQLGQPLIQFMALDFSDFAPPYPTPLEWIYHTAQSEATPWAAVYNKEFFLLMDPQTEEIQEIYLGKESSELSPDPRWALNVQWSPDGNHLAIIATLGRLPNTFRRLLIYNVETQNLKQIDIPRNFVLSNVAWFPNSRFLLAQGAIGYTNEGYGIQGNLLVDPQASQTRPVDIVATNTIGGSAQNALTWSLDGKIVVMVCLNPTQDYVALCVSEVSVK